MAKSGVALAVNGMVFQRPQTEMDSAASSMLWQHSLEGFFER